MKKLFFLAVIGLLLAFICHLAEAQDYKQAKNTEEACQLYKHIEPDWEAEVDADVPAEKGGKGFAVLAKKNGWETADEYYPYLGDPRAIKCGQMRQSMSIFPNVIRYY